MAEIRILDKHTAELIAAGEVVERPSSAVKEMLENSIDAGATKITVSIQNGGVTFMEVSDNGSGIEAEYIRNAFVRHATSKISAQEDLAHIHTLGFRGEALASIASVARVEVLTRTEQDDFACLYRIEGGEEQGLETAARPVGTTITVRDLFYNTPARMKFLKRDATEGLYVGAVVDQLAISHPEVSIRFVRDGKNVYITPGDGKLRSAVYTVLGREFARDLLAVEAENGVYRVSGLVTSPKAGRGSRSMEHFFLNGRSIKNKTMMAALEAAYKGVLMQGKFPGAILMLEMPAELVDVNVHPAKVEVRFAREKDVFDAVYRAVKNALAAPGSGERSFVFEKEASEAPEDKIELEMQGHGLSAVLPNPPAKASGTCADYAAVPRIEPLWWQKGSEPAGMQSAGYAGGIAKEFLSEPREESVLDILPEPEAAEAPQGKTQPSVAMVAAETDAEAVATTPSAAPMHMASVPAEPEQLQLTEQAPEELLYVGEVFHTYIIAQRGQEICLIDKHAAHERVLYEKLAASLGDVASQMLLVPENVNVSAQEKQALLENQELLLKAGIDFDDFGGNTILVRGVPADVEGQTAKELLCEIAEKLAKGVKDPYSEKMHWVLHSIACRAAIKGGDRSSPEELLYLARQIMDGEVPPFCPHGRPCVLKITRKELEKQFGRLV